MSRVVNNFIVLLLGLLAPIAYVSIIIIVILVTKRKKRKMARSGMRTSNYRRKGRTMVRKNFPGPGKMSTKDLARSAYITSRRAYNKAQGELKHGVIEQAYTTTPDLGSDALYQLDNTAQGVSQSQRIGLVTQPIGVTVRGQLRQGQSVRGHSVRIMIFRFKNENGTIIGMDDVIRFPGDGRWINQPKKFDLRRNSVILYDKVYTLNQFGSDDSTVGTERVGKNIVHFTIHCNLRQFPTVFLGSDSSGITKTSGGTYIAFCSDDSAGPPSAPEHRFSALYTYRDA